MEKKHCSDYIEEFLGSGQTSRQFALEHGMNVNSFRMALRRKKAGSPMPVVIAPPDPKSEGAARPVEVRVDVGGTELRFALEDQEQLVRLIGGLKNV